MQQTDIVLSLLIPLFNEERNAAEVVRRNLETALRLHIGFEIVAIDDGSSDATADILRRLQLPQLRIVTHKTNQGLGRAVRSGLHAARGQYCIVSPADNPHTPDVLRRFLERADGADLVLGYRPRRLGYSPLMRLNSWLYHAVLRLVCGLPYRDLNWIHLYRRTSFTCFPQRFKGVVAAAELVLLARSRGYRIVEVECPMTVRVHGRASASRPRVMLRTACDLIRLLWCWRSARAGQP